MRWVLLAAALGLAAHFSRGYFESARGPAYPTHAFHQVKRGDMLVSIVEDGALRALNETVVRSALDGNNRIIHLAPEGSHVKKGELLVELDSSSLKDRLNEQELAYQERLFQFLQAQGNLKIQKSLAESQVKEAELALENAEGDLEKYREGDAPLLIRIVEARIGVLQEQVRIATERLARTEVLYKTGSATRSELEADALSLKKEQLALSQYQEDLRLIKKYDQPNQIQLLQSKVDEAKKELERLKQRTASEIAAAEADLKTSQRTVSFLEESVQTMKERLENAKIFAPQDGLVVYASASPIQSFPEGMDSQRSEGRFRGGRGGGGGFGGDSSREFRGGGSRGGRSTQSGGTLSSSSPASSSTAQTVAAANQRAASAISGSSAAESGTGGSTSPQGGGGTSSRGGGGGGGSGGDVQSASRSFASYASMRPSSSIPATSSAGGSGGAGGSASSSSPASGGSQSYSGGLNNSQFSSRSQNNFSFGGFGGFEAGSSGFVEEGMMVRQRQELIRLPDVSKMLAEVKVHESRVRQVKQGMIAHVKIENLPNQVFKGTVRRVALLPDSQMTWLNPNLKVFPTDILIEDELPDLKPGVSARAEIIITNLTKVLTVPIHTVARVQGENVCFVRKGAAVAPVPVTTGWYNDRFVEIVAGLKEGDLVLLAPQGDEQIGSAAEETNSVQKTEPPAQEPPPQREQTPPENGAEMRRRPRGEMDSAEGGERPAERRRGRPGQGQGRRGQNPQEVPE